MRLALTLTGLLLLGYSVIVMGLYFGQRRLMYFPTNANSLPEAVGLRDVRMETVPTPDGEALVVWHADAAPGQPMVLYFQGNGGEIANRSDRFAAYQAAGFGVTFVSYRGYGGSSGTPSEAGLITDANAVYDWLQAAGVAGEDIAIVGESLGTGVAVQLAAARPSGALVLGAPYSATDDIAAAQYPWVPVRWLMHDRFRSVDHIGSVTVPILIQHGTADTVVPYASGEVLYQAAPLGTMFVPRPNQGHEMLYQPATWAEEIRFIQQVFAER